MELLSAPPLSSALCVYSISLVSHGANPNSQEPAAGLTAVMQTCLQSHILPSLGSSLLPPPLARDYDRARVERLASRGPTPRGLPTVIDYFQTHAQRPLYLGLYGRWCRIGAKSWHEVLDKRLNSRVRVRVRGVCVQHTELLPTACASAAACLSSVCPQIL